MRLDGAVDYITKPFELKELIASKGGAQNKAVGRVGGHGYGDIEENTDSKTVTVSGKEISLTRTEAALLKVLIKSGGKTVRPLFYRRHRKKINRPRTVDSKAFDREIGRQHIGVICRRQTDYHGRFQELTTDITTADNSVSTRIKTLTPVFKKRVDKFGRYDIIKCGHLIWWV